MALHSFYFFFTSRDRQHLSESYQTCVDFIFCSKMHIAINFHFVWCFLNINFFLFSLFPHLQVHFSGRICGKPMWNRVQFHFFLHFPLRWKRGKFQFPTLIIYSNAFFWVCKWWNHSTFMVMKLVQAFDVICFRAEIKCISYLSRIYKKKKKYFCFCVWHNPLSFSRRYINSP